MYVFVIERVELASMNWFYGTKQVATADMHRQANINEFLMFTRYLLEPTHVANSAESADDGGSNPSLPLESDALSIEFLAGHGYNVDAAKARLMCMLSAGKGMSLCLSDLCLSVHLGCFGALLLTVLLV